MTSFKGKRGFVNSLLLHVPAILLMVSASHMAEVMLAQPYKAQTHLELDAARGAISENFTTPDNSSETIDVSLNYPDNNTWNTNQAINHGYTPIINNGEFANCSLFTNKTGSWEYATNAASISNNSPNYLSFDYGGDYNEILWNIYCYDANTVSNYSSVNFTLKIDSTPPTTPTLANQSNGATWINLGIGSCSDFGSGVAKKLLYRNTTNIVNLTTEDSYNDTGLSEFTYAYELSCLDNVGNYGSNSTTLLANTSKITPPTEVPVPPRNQSATQPMGNAENITYVHPSHLAKGETVKYTPTSETHCIKSTCVATLYSVQNFIQDKQGNWKHIGEIASLTYSANILNISWNKRSILLQPYIVHNGVYMDKLPQEYNFSISYTNFVDYIKFRPRIKFVDGLTEFGFKKVSWSNDEVVINFDDLAANNFEVTQNETHISIRNLEGKVSSNEMLELDPTITLNESNLGNVGDSFTNSSDTGVNYGTLQYLSVRSYNSGDVRRIFLLFNLSVIPSSATITDANLSLYMFVAPTNSRTYSAYNTSNSWTETGITQSNQPAQGTLQQGVTVTTPANVWESWNVTNAAVSSYAQTNKNMSIMIRDNTETATTARFAMFVSKENTTDTSKRPQLIITYVTPPTYSDNSTSSTSANTNVEHRLKWQSETELSGYIFSFCNGTYQKPNITQNTATYTFLDNVTNNAYWASPVNPITSPAGGTQATAVQYANMSLNDSSFARVLGDAASNDDPYWSMNFTINETTASINWINVSLGGYKVLTGGSEAATCYVFNWTSETWLSIAVLTTSPTIISSNYTSGISDIVNASTKVLNVYCTGAQFDLNEGIYLDFVSVVVNSSNTTYSTANCSDANAVLTNDSWVAMTGTLNWSNVTKMITSTEGATVKWCVYANGTANEWNSTSCVNHFSYITTAAPSGLAPTYSQNSTNSTVAGTNVQHNLRWANGSVGAGLSGYIFSFCNGTWDGVQCNTTTTTNVVYGKTDIGNLQDSANLNYIIAQNVTIPHDVTLTNITFYTTVAGNFSVAIYDGLTPTNLLVNSTFAPCGAAAWCTFSISPTFLASGNCWLAVETDNNGNTFKYVDNASDTNYYVAQTYGTWANPYGSGTAQQRTYSFYANGTYNTTTSSGVNDSWVAFTPSMCPFPYTDCWSNVTKLVNSTVGATIKWCVYVNDSLNNWNSTSCILPFNYTTTATANYYSSGTNLCGYYTGTSASCGAANTFCAAGTYYPTQSCSATPTYTSCQTADTTNYCAVCGDCAGGADTCGTATCGTTYGCAGGNVCNGQGTGAGNCVAPAGNGTTCYCDAMCTTGYGCVSNVCKGNIIGFTITLPGPLTIPAAEGGNATADIEFNLTGGNTASNVAPCLAGTSTCQTSGTPIFVFTNTGTAILNWYVYLDTALPASMTLKGDTDNNPFGATTVTTAGWLVASSVAPSGSQNAWLWTDFNGASVSDVTSRTIKNNATST